MTAKELYEAGRLSDAVTAGLAEVKAAPGDTAARTLLATICCFTADLERVDRQLDMLKDLDPKVAVGVSMLQQLVRAEQARRQFFAEGRVPEFLVDPSESLKLLMQASIRLREGAAVDAMALLAEADEKRPKLTGTCNGKPFSDFRDQDDLTAAFFEVLTSNGKYYWVPFERVELLELRPLERIRDRIWRRTRMVVRDGPDGEVFLPCLYAGSESAAKDSLRLGRETDWLGESGSPVRGVGLRSYWVDKDDVTILDLNELTFASA